MSKAFTKEDSDAPAPKPVRRSIIPVPTPNYVTARGLDALRDEHARLAATAPRTPDDDARLHELADHLATAQLAPPHDAARVGFGATVTVEDDDGRRTAYTIVGAIEATPATGEISWQSPIARALDEAVVGDRIALPRGEVTIMAIAYARSR